VVEKKKKIMPKGKKFTSENQPSPEAKSKGQTKRYERKNLKKDMFNEMFNKPLLGKNGKESNTLDEMIQLFKKALFASEDVTKMSLKERSDLGLKVADFLGIKEIKNMHTDGEGEPLKIQLYMPDNNRNDG